ncbi:MAG: rhodanese-like domain-containing protein [Bacteroidota bacterium]
MVTTKSVFPIFFLLVFNLFGVGCGTSPTASYTNVAVEDFKVRMQAVDVIVLDVRTPAETAQGIISNAQQLNFHAADFKTQLAELDQDKTYLVYCKSGGRSSSTCEMMVAMGFTEVINLEGGYTAWSAWNKSKPD